MAGSAPCPDWSIRSSLETAGDIVPQQQWLEPVGATSTILCEQLQAKKITLSPTEATVLALGIHADTGSLTFEQTTVRDVQALAWLLKEGANQRAIATYSEAGLSEHLRPLLQQAWANLQQVVHQGYRLGWVLLHTTEYLPGLSQFITQLADLCECDAILLGHQYRQHHLAIIARSQIPHVNVAHLLAPLGGGGHAPSGRSDDYHRPARDSAQRGIYSTPSADSPIANSGRTDVLAPCEPYAPETPHCRCPPASYCAMATLVCRW